MYFTLGLHYYLSLESISFMALHTEFKLAYRFIQARAKEKRLELFINYIMYATYM